ncbi:MAG: hypothetical protein RL307_1130 [Pseudomonadota bacterium]
MSTMVLTHLIYLHGFRSSSQSTKARRMAQWVNAVNTVDAQDMRKPQSHKLQWLCPDLPPSPAQAFDLVLQLTRSWPSESMAVMGSSLGGFYAARLASIKACKAVLLNPAVEPARDLVHHLGIQTAWHDPSQTFELKPEHVDELQALRVGPGTAWPDAQDMLSVIATGDEVLDWQEMVARYGYGRVHLIQGSDHGLSDFEDHLPVIETFLNEFPS